MKGRTEEAAGMSGSIMDRALAASNIQQKERYTPKEAQRITGVSIETNRRVLRAGSLKGQRVSHNWLFIYHDDLAELLNQDQK